MVGQEQLLDDMVDSVVDVDAIRADFVHDYEHPEVDTLRSMFEELGGYLDVEVDEDDGFMDLTSVLDQVDALEYCDWTIEDVESIFRAYRVQLPNLLRTSYSAGAGIRRHEATSKHDVALGKAE